MTLWKLVGAWLENWRFRRCAAHNIIGFGCSRCGWPLRLFNVYLPPQHPGLSSWQKHKLRRRLSPPHVVVKEHHQEGCEAMHWGTVGFELTMEDHVWLTEQLMGIRMVEVPR